MKTSYVNKTVLDGADFSETVTFVPHRKITTFFGFASTFFLVFINMTQSFLALLKSVLRVLLNALYYGSLSLFPAE